MEGDILPALAAATSSNKIDDPDLTHSASPSMPEAQCDATGGNLRPALTSRCRDPDRYQIVNEHGRGGLGRVFRAHDLELGRDVAIKELLSRGSTGEVRFLREALITARLEHPGIVPVHEAGLWPDGTPFYAMKLVAGRPLRDLIAERKTVQERLGLLHHVIAVADAIAYAHGRNIIHRDLKPANVIVGDFGETIVIDWGLAKDLSNTTATWTREGFARNRQDDELTAAGCIVGTPAYMAPEQERGEAVDERADVFAIGAMLWELCSLQKVPPSDLHLRHRMLRRAGVDQDFITIIDKSLHPQRAGRYPNAGALASDLKAFKSGVRIAARNYSLYGLLKHWGRRHRTLAVSVAILAIIVSIGVPIYITNINAERRRTDDALSVATQSNDSLTIAHAELLIKSDPTNALEVLSRYSGGDQERRRELTAEARGRGVAQIVARPHNDTIWFMKGMNDGSFISVAEDHRIQHTSLAGVITTIASDVSSTVRLSYAAKAHILAYSTSPNGVGLIELTTLLRRDVPVSAVSRIAISANGTELAVLTKDSVALWDISRQPKRRYQMAIDDARSVAVHDSLGVIVMTSTGLLVIAGNGTVSATLSLNVASFAVVEDAIIAGLSDGSLAVLSMSLKKTSGVQGCASRVGLVAVADGSSTFAFGCAEGLVGVARYIKPSYVLQIMSTFDVPKTTWKIVMGSTGSMAIAIADRTVFCHDVAAGVTKRLDGQEARLASVTPPDADYDSILTGDINGTARVWRPPLFKSRVIARVPGTAFGTRFSPDGKYVAIYGASSSVRILDSNTHDMKMLVGHTGAISGVHFSRDGARLMSFSRDGMSSCWRVPDGHLLRAFKGHHTVVEDGDFIDGGRRVVSAGDDGKLFAWNPETEETQLLLSLDHPIVALEVLNSANAVVTHDSSGNLWSTTSEGATSQVRHGTGVAITIMRASPSGDRLAIGEESGNIIVFNTATWEISNRLRVDGPVARIEFDPRSRDVLATVDNRFAYLLPLANRDRAGWTRIRLEAHDISYSENGDMMAIATLDGGIWFYSFPYAKWLYVQEHATEVWAGQFSPDSSQFVSADRDGGVNTWQINASFWH